ncbi:Contactin-Associated Protein 1 [Manis pentadactyla]|nr:Contactin-Associated Protein 1 [Manis pentadactyla]
METRLPGSGSHILSCISSLSISASAYSQHPYLCTSLAVKATLELTLAVLAHIYWNQGYGYQQGYGPGYGGSDDSPHGYYGYGPGYYYSLYISKGDIRDGLTLQKMKMIMWLINP